MENNGEHKLGDIIIESHYMDSGLLILGKKDNIVCWGEWQDKPYNDSTIFSSVSPDEIEEFLKNNTIGKSLINSIENHHIANISLNDEREDYMKYCDYWSECSDNI